MITPVIAAYCGFLRLIAGVVLEGGLRSAGGRKCRTGPGVAWGSLSRAGSRALGARVSRPARRARRARVLPTRLAHAPLGHCVIRALFSGPTEPLKGRGWIRLQTSGRTALTPSTERESHSSGLGGLTIPVVNHGEDHLRRKTCEMVNLCEMVSMFSRPPCVKLRPGRAPRPAGARPSPGLRLIAAYCGLLRRVAPVNCLNERAPARRPDCP